MEPPYIYIFDACASIYFDNYLFEHKFPLGWDAKRRRVFFRNSSGNLDKHLTPVIFSVLCAMMWVCVLLVLNTSYQPYPEFSRLAFTSAVTMFSGFFAYGGMIYNEIVRKRYEAVFGYNEVLRLVQNLSNGKSAVQPKSIEYNTQNNLATVLLPLSTLWTSTAR